jgi:hypothetical protein
MPELIIAVRDYAGWLYVGLALLALRELVILLRSGREHDVAMFRLQREAATGRAVRALITLFLLATIGMGVFLVSAVLAPALPYRATFQAHRDEPLIETPPTVVLPTDTPTPPPAVPTRRVPRIVTAPPETPEPTSVTAAGGACSNPDLQILSPEAGAVVGTDLQVAVTVRFPPASGRSFRLELGQGAAPTSWRALGEPRTEPAEALVVGELPHDLPSGPYVLKLVLAEPSGDVLPENVCQLPFRVP